MPLSWTSSACRRVTLLPATPATLSWTQPAKFLTEVEHVHTSLRIRNRTWPQPLDHRYRGTTRL